MGMPLAAVTGHSPKVGKVKRYNLENILFVTELR